MLHLRQKVINITKTQRNVSMNGPLAVASYTQGWNLSLYGYNNYVMHMWKCFFLLVLQFSHPFRVWQSLPVTKKYSNADINSGLKVTFPNSFCKLSSDAIICNLCFLYRIYIVHDEVKDKAFELELSWVGDMTNGRHELVPKDVAEEANKYGKVRQLHLLVWVTWATDYNFKLVNDVYGIFQLLCEPIGTFPLRACVYTLHLHLSGITLVCELRETLQSHQFSDEQCIECWLNVALDALDVMGVLLPILDNFPRKFITHYDIPIGLNISIIHFTLIRFFFLNFTNNKGLSNIRSLLQVFTVDNQPNQIQNSS